MRYKNINLGLSKEAVSFLKVLINQFVIDKKQLIQYKKSKQSKQSISSFDKSLETLKHRLSLLNAILYKDKKTYPYMYDDLAFKKSLIKSISELNNKQLLKNIGDI